MRRFATLLDRLVLTPRQSIKLRLIVEYLRNTPDPDRGYALAALIGDLDIVRIKPAILRALAADRVDEVLFAYSHDYVGDLAETISLIWPAPIDGIEKDRNASPRLAEIVERLLAASRGELAGQVEGYLDSLHASGRWALIKLVTGGLRVDVSAQLVKQALADFGNREISEIEEIWHGLAPPYLDLFAWLEQRGARPRTKIVAPFYPVMLAHSLGDNELELITPDAYAAEWKWDGIRIQAVRDQGIARLYTRSGEDISKVFPDIVEALDFDGVLDGELLIGDKGESGFTAGPFSLLQKRLDRKTVSAKLMASHPAFIRAYDCLVDNGEDLRGQTFGERRKRLENLAAHSRSDRIDISPLLLYANGGELQAFRAAPPQPAIEGLMLKRWDSIYEPGRPMGPWYKWRRDPHIVDAVLMYAQRGHGERSSYYSDCTFGLWRDGEAGRELVPIGKAHFDFTDTEVETIDRFVRDNTLNRFGPVREVVHDGEEGLVLEVAFDGVLRSTRHKSGVALRFPRISRFRRDKSPKEADKLETLEPLIPADGG
jgi:DNA ligase 1